MANSKKLKEKEGYRIVTTSTGFTCQVEIDALNDMRVMKIIRQIEHSDDTEQAFLFNDLAELILSADDYNKLEKHVETESGRVPVDKIYSEFAEIFNNLKEAKN